MNDWILRMFMSVFEGGVGNYREVLVQGPDMFPEVWTAVLKIYRNITLPAGLGFMVIFLLIEILSRNIEFGKNISMGLFIKPFLGFIIGFAVMFGINPPANLEDNQATTMVAIMNIGHALTDEILNKVVGDEVASGEIDHVAMAEQVVVLNEMTQEGWAGIENAGTPSAQIVVQKKLGMLDTVGTYIRALIPWLMMMAGSLMVSIIIYGRLFEMYLMVSVAPFAMADISIKGTESTGFIYLKNFMALMLQGSLILIVIHIFSIVQVSSWGGGLSGLLPHIALFWAQMTLLGKTRSVAKGLVGVH